jgi:hypothetical protein
MTTKGEIAYLREHVRYEVVMVRWAFKQIQSLPPSLERNAFIECFAVHARALFEFLTSKGDTRSVDALVYVDGFKPDGAADASRKVTTLNEQVFHLRRTDDTNLKFDASDDGAWVLQWLEAALDKFNSELSSPYPNDWLPAKTPSVPVSKDRTPSPYMVEKHPKRPNNNAKALESWESEGGAPVSGDRSKKKKRPPRPKPVGKAHGRYRDGRR